MLLFNLTKVNANAPVTIGSCCLRRVLERSTERGRENEWQWGKAWLIERQTERSRQTRSKRVPVRAPGTDTDKQRKDWKIEDPGATVPRWHCWTRDSSRLLLFFYRHSRSWGWQSLHKVKTLPLNYSLSVVEVGTECLIWWLQINQ